MSEMNLLKPHERFSVRRSRDVAGEECGYAMHLSPDPPKRSEELCTILSNNLLTSLRVVAWGKGHGAWSMGHGAWRIMNNTKQEAGNVKHNVHGDHNREFHDRIVGRWMNRQFDHDAGAVVHGNKFSRHAPFSLHDANLSVSE
ncbi:MAG: hypothetical protein ABEK50_06965 [bacterium]